MRIALRIALAASAALLTLGVAQAQEKTLRIGTEGAYPPFNNLTSDGQLVGFDIDIAKALCDEMKVKCTFVAQDWDGIIPALQAGKFDAIVASMSITPERQQKVDFTHKYYNTPSALAVPKDSTLKGVTKADLAGKTIGVATTTTHFNYASKTYTDSTIKGYPSSPEEQADLANGRLDAIEDDIVVLSQWLDTPDGACCKILGTPDPQPVEIFGPGAGSFFVFAFVRLLGYDFLNASVSAKLLNLATNVAAIILFASKGHVWWHFALPLAVANVAGSLLGTHMALRHGTGFVRAIFILVVSLLILKTGYDAFLR